MRSDPGQVIICEFTHTHTHAHAHTHTHTHNTTTTTNTKIFAVTGAESEFNLPFLSFVIFTLPSTCQLSFYSLLSFYSAFHLSTLFPLFCHFTLPSTCQLFFLSSVISLCLPLVNCLFTLPSTCQLSDMLLCLPLVNSFSSLLSFYSAFHLSTLFPLFCHFTLPSTCQLFFLSSVILLCLPLVNSFSSLLSFYSAFHLSTLFLLHGCFLVCFPDIFLCDLQNTRGLKKCNIIITFKGAIRDFLQSPHCAANRLQHVRSSGPGAVECKSRATHRALVTLATCRVTCHVVRRKSSAIKFNRV